MLRYGVDLAAFACVSGTYLFQRTAPDQLSVAGPYRFPLDPDTYVDSAITNFISQVDAQLITWSTFFRFVYLASRVSHFALHPSLSCSW